jgi:hypothetical protein
MVSGQAAVPRYASSQPGSFSASPG